MAPAGAGGRLRSVPWLFNHKAVTCRRGDSDQLPPAAPQTHRAPAQHPGLYEFCNFTPDETLETRSGCPYLTPFQTKRCAWTKRKTCTQFGARAACSGLGNGKKRQEPSRPAARKGAQRDALVHAQPCRHPLPRPGSRSSVLGMTLAHQLMGSSTQKPSKNREALTKAAAPQRASSALRVTLQASSPRARTGAGASRRWLCHLLDLYRCKAGSSGGIRPLIGM